MVQLQHDQEKFSAHNTQIVVIVPNGPFMIKRYLKRNPLPYIILTDRGGQVAKLYKQSRPLNLVGIPLVILIEQGGTIAYAHYAKSLIAEPDNNEPLAVLAKIKPD